LNLNWNRYAAVGVGFGWEQQERDRVVYDNLQNYITAFHELIRLGYRRIGTVLGAVHELKKMDKRSIFEPKMGSLREGELLFALPKGVILGQKAAFRHF